MTSTEIAIIALSTIVGIFIGNFLGKREGYIKGFQAGIKDEQMWMGLAITKAFSDNKEEALKKVVAEYNILHNELKEKPGIQ